MFFLISISFILRNNRPVFNAIKCKVPAQAERKYRNIMDTVCEAVFMPGLFLRVVRLLLILSPPYILNTKLFKKF